MAKETFYTYVGSKTEEIAPDFAADFGLIKDTSGSTVDRLKLWRFASSKGADIASAATLNFDASAGSWADVTGTTTVTAVTLSEGRIFTTRFTGILTLTHGASLVLPNNATNITTAAGDWALWAGYAGGVVRCIAYQRFNGQALQGGGGFTSASTTEVLTGTETAKGVTPDSLAAIWEQGADIASAGTISVGEGGYFNVTGTTTITDIDFATDKAGRKVWLKFAGILTLTHHATTLILPTGANIVTAAGDIACFISEGTDNVRCISYTRASGAALVGGSSSPLTLTANVAAEVPLTLKGHASQTEHLLDITKSDNTEMVYIEPSDSNSWALKLYNPGSAHTASIRAYNYNGLWLGSSDNQVVIGDYNPSTQTAIFNTATSGSEPNLKILSQAVGKPGIAVKLAGSPTADGIEVRNNSETVLWGVTATGATRFLEQSDPAAPATNIALLYAKDNGSGKTQIVARFATGAVQVIATEP